VTVAVKRVCVSVLLMLLTVSVSPPSLLNSHTGCYASRAAASDYSSSLLLK